MHEQADRPLLDLDQQRDVCAILVVGGSRQAAAAYVGCRVEAIEQTAGALPAFAARLARAEQQHELNQLQNVQSAAKNDRYWRAAAWVLERLYPHRYGPRRPRSMPLDEVVKLLGDFADAVLVEVPAEHQEPVRARLSAMIARLKVQSRRLPR